MANETAGDGADELFDPNEILIVESLWFLAPFPRPDDPLAFVRTIARLVPFDGNPVIPAFTDRYLAEDWIMEQEGQNSTLKPFPCATPAAMMVLLQTLIALGFSTLSLDPKGDRVPLLPITTVLDAMRNRRR